MLIEILHRLKKSASEEGALLLPLELFIDKELLEGPLVPIDYVDGDRLVRAYDASVLVVCNMWLRAREEGELLMRALADTGIVALVDEVTGYEKVRRKCPSQISGIDNPQRACGMEKKFRTRSMRISIS